MIVAVPLWTGMQSKVLGKIILTNTTMLSVANRSWFAIHWVLRINWPPPPPTTPFSQKICTPHLSTICFLPNFMLANNQCTPTVLWIVPNFVIQLSDKHSLILIQQDDCTDSDARLNISNLPVTQCLAYWNSLNLKQIEAQSTCAESTNKGGS